MTADPNPASEEFDTEAAWTVEVLAGLAPDEAIPGACRGSGDPASLDWLADALEVNQASRFLDLGGGIGGPAAWLRQRQGCDPVVAEPMIDAVRGARALFDLASVAVLDRLPFAGGAFDAAWALAVLSTVDDKALALSELHRVLAPGGHLGLQEYLRTAERVDDPPAGNDFLSFSELTTASLAPVSTSWRTSAPTSSMRRRRTGRLRPIRSSRRWPSATPARRRWRRVCGRGAGSPSCWRTGCSPSGSSTPPASDRFGVVPRIGDVDAVDRRSVLLAMLAVRSVFTG